METHDTTTDPVPNITETPLNDINTQADATETNGGNDSAHQPQPHSPSQNSNETAKPPRQYSLWELLRHIDDDLTEPTDELPDSNSTVLANTRQSVWPE